MNNLTLHFDGLTEPTNPGGYGCYGFVIRRGEEIVASGKGNLGREYDDQPMTNNIAEYVALVKGLEYIAANEKPDHLAVYGDSKLVVEQVSGRWRINRPHLRVLVLKCVALLEPLRGKYTLEWVPREQNTEADALSGEAYTEVTGKAVLPRWRPGR